MDKNKFRAMLIFLIPQLVKEIVDQENISETEATRSLYESELYAALEEEETKLLNRLEKYQENHLLFLRDFSVPFENNLSERDLRKCKNRQKMSGGFRKQSGNEMYCSIMSIIETCKRKQIRCNS